MKPSRNGRATGTGVAPGFGAEWEAVDEVSPLDVIGLFGAGKLSNTRKLSNNEWEDEADGKPTKITELIRSSKNNL
ncbi:MULTISPECIES: hypothetical protein [Caldilinea]|jgi:hypothetical protein|uniref:hypothetical protein n=1 Tax=Caldilinea TaxID=233191 RepID=UPI0013967293|nr:MULTISPECIES: hypothetical protein [Caldilinea]MBO9392168.1 hypothetical protein [Caldilinea sp.]